VFLRSEENCKYIFTWATDLACVVAPPTPQTSCTVTDPNSQLLYDLTPLIRNYTNWIAVDDSEAFYFTYSFNLCRPLVSSNNTMSNCSAPGVAGCQAIRNQTTSFISLGQVSAPYLQDGSVAITMNSVGIQLLPVSSTDWLTFADRDHLAPVATQRQQRSCSSAILMQDLFDASIIWHFSMTNYSIRDTQCLPTSTTCAVIFSHGRHLPHVQSRFQHHHHVQ